MRHSFTTFVLQRFNTAMLWHACLLLGFTAFAGADDIFHEPLPLTRGPDGPIRGRRQYNRTEILTPIPLASGASHSSTGRPQQLPESTDNPTLTSPRPAPSFSTSTGSGPLYTYDPAVNTSSGHLPFIYNPTGTSPRPHGSGRPRPHNGTCSGKTVNVLSASLDWWYTETYTQTDSTFLIHFNGNDTATGWTLQSQETPFNVTSAVANPTCVSTTAFNVEANSTMMSYSCWQTPTPVAAATTTVEQSAYVPVNATTAKGSVPDVGVSPTPASLTVGASNATTQIYTSGAPIVHFSEFEVVTKRPTQFDDGYVECIESTRACNLSTVQSFEYQGNVDQQMAISGDVVGKINFALLRAFGEADATPGSWVAEPTVVVVVQKVLAAAPVAAASAFAMPFETEASASSLDTPTPTLPPYIETARSTPTEPGQTWLPLTAQIETSETALDVPTRSNGNDFVVNTVKAAVQPPNGVLNGGVLGNVLSDIGQNGQPTNAVEVLTKAEATFDSGDAAASAIAAIIGAVPLPGSNHGNRQGSNPAAGIPDIEGDGASSISSSDGQNGGSGSGGSGSGSGFGTSFEQHQVFHIGSQDFTASPIEGNASPGFVIDGQTAFAGGAPISIEGTPVSVGPGATGVMIGDTFVKVGSSTAGVIFFANIPLITVGSRTFTANAATQFNLDGATLTPGGQAIYEGTTISLGLGATNVVVNGQTQGIGPPAITPAPLLNIGGTAYRANIGSTYNVGGHMLTPGEAVTVSGTTISIPTDLSNVIVNGVTRSVGGAAANVANMATITAPPVLTVDGQAFAANGGTQYVISGQTLTPGGVITFSGPQGLETVSLNVAANELVTVAKGVTGTSYVAAIGAAPSGAPVLTIDDQNYTAVDYNIGSGATYIISGQTLTPGGLITIQREDGPTTLSLLPAGTAIVDVHSGTTTTSQIVGAYGVLPTQPPVLTIGNEMFTAINGGPTYVLDGDTLTPGGTDTVVVDGKTYVVTLSPQATMLEIEVLGANSQVISTIFETLFPATISGSTIYNTLLVSATAGATATDTPAFATSTDAPNSSNKSSSTRSIEMTAALLAIVSLGVAVWF